MVGRSLVRTDNAWENIGEGEQILAFGITGPVCPGAGPAGTLREATTAFGLRSRTNGTLGSLQARIGALFRDSACTHRQGTAGSGNSRQGDRWHQGTTRQVPPVPLAAAR